MVDKLLFVPTKSTSVIDSAVADVCILLDLEQDRTVELNPQASAIWNLIDGNNTLGAIVQQLSIRYSASEQTLIQDVEAFIGLMQEQKFVIDDL